MEYLQELKWPVFVITGFLILILMIISGIVCLCRGLVYKFGKSKYMENRSRIFRKVVTRSMFATGLLLICIPVAVIYWLMN